LSDELKLSLATCVRNPNAAPGQPTYTGTNPRTLQGWTRVRVTTGIERFPRDFEVSYTEAFPNAADVIVQEGDICQVFIGDDLVLTGFVDKRMQRIGRNEHTLAVSGRGKCSDLLDCAAYWPGNQFLNQPILSIASRLAGIYGVTVNLDLNANGGDPIAQVVPIPSESVFTVLERLARFRGLLLLEQPDGSLLLSAVSTLAMASGFQEGINVESATTVFSMDGRYSDYIALRQSLDFLKDIGSGGNLVAHLIDPGVQRLRYRIIVAEPVYTGIDVVTLRAQWELNRRYGRSLQVKILTDSWRDSSGALWQPNRLVSVNVPTLKLSNVQWLISEVTFSLDENGTHAELTIMPPQGFLPEPLILFPVKPDIAQTV
jgi:prophage tail gpP-like protein